MPKHYLSLFAAVLLAAWSGAEPAASTPLEGGSVQLFSGWVIPIIDSTAGTGAEDMKRTIEALGIRAELDDPDAWARVAEHFVQGYDGTSPVAVVGYSLGADAAIMFCQRLAARKIAVQSLVVIEAHDPGEVPDNVAHAVQFFVSGMAMPLRPAPGFSGTLQNIDLTLRFPDAAKLNHWSVSHYRRMHDAVLAEVLSGHRLRIWVAAARAQAPRRAPASKPLVSTRTGRSGTRGGADAQPEPPRRGM